jgi:hypothetical protein
VVTEEHFRSVTYYIHSNAVKHGLAESVPDWEWSSYRDILSVKPTFLNREKTLEYFDGLSKFTAYHAVEHNFTAAGELLLEE